MSQSGNDKQNADVCPAQMSNANADHQFLEAKRVEHERARLAHQAKFDADMRQLEADQLAEVSRLSGKPADANGNGNGDADSAPASPSAQENDLEVNGGTNGSAGAIGQGREAANGAKSMPASRRASGYGTFGMEKLSLSVMDEGTGRNKWEEEEVDDQVAHSEWSSTPSQSL